MNVSSHTKSVSFSNQKCMTEPIIINLHPKKYYAFAVVNLDRCVRTCNTRNGLSNEICVPNKTSYLCVSVFSMITRINTSKTLTKHTWCECKCKFFVENVIQIKSGITTNVGARVKTQKSIMFEKKIIFGTLLHVVAKMEDI